MGTDLAGFDESVSDFSGVIVPVCSEVSERADCAFCRRRLLKSFSLERSAELDLRFNEAIPRKCAHCRVGIAAWTAV